MGVYLDLKEGQLCRFDFLVSILTNILHKFCFKSLCLSVFVIIQATCSFVLALLLTLSLSLYDILLQKILALGYI